MGHRLPRFGPRSGPDDARNAERLIAALDGFSLDAGFLDAPRAGSWEPGAVSENVMLTYAHFELYLAVHPEAYTPNHMIGRGPEDSSWSTPLRGGRG